MKIAYDVFGFDNGKTHNTLYLTSPQSYLDVKSIAYKMSSVFTGVIGKKSLPFASNGCAI